MTSGFFQSTFFPDDFWHEDFWQDYAPPSAQAILSLVSYVVISLAYNNKVTAVMSRNNGVTKSQTFNVKVG